MRRQRLAKKHTPVDKSVLAIGGCPRFEDQAYLDWLKTQRCIITGFLGSERDAIDPLHVGTLGRGVKSHDYWALPVLHSLHAEGHAKGEITMFRKYAPDDVLRAALRAYAKEMHSKWRVG